MVPVAAVDGRHRRVQNITELRDRFAALRTQIKATEDATIAQSEFGQQLHELPELLGTSTEEIAEMSKALVESRKAARDSAETFVGLGKFVDDAEVSLSDWIAELERNAKALREFRRNATEAAEKGLDDGLIASLHEAGAAAPYGWPSSPTPSTKRSAEPTGAWRSGDKQIDLYIDAVGGVPEDIATELHLSGVGSAIKTIDTLRHLITGNPIEQQVVIVGPDGKETKAKAGSDFSLDGLLFGGHADGGTVAGPRYPYGDKVITALAPGEEVITNRNGEADQQLRADRAAGRIPAYANGGTVDWNRVDAGRRSSYSAGSATVTAQLSRADLDYTAERLAQVRPLYGTVNMQPHDYNEFRREQEADMRRSSIGGVPWSR